MSMKNTRESYGTVTKVFHWGIALTVYFMLALGYFLESIKPQWLQDQAYTFHKSIGMTVLVVLIARFIWRLANPTPQPPNTMATWQLVVSRLVHYGLYASLLTMPIAGLIMETASGYTPSFFGLFDVRLPGINTSKMLANQAHSVHIITAYVLISLIVVHVLAALKHHLIDKDDVLKRMLPNFNQTSDSTPKPTNTQTNQETA